VTAVPAPPATGRRWLGLIVGIAVSVLAVALFFRSVSLPELSRGLSRLDVRWLVAGFACLAADYWLRCWRWAAMLRAANPAVGAGQVAGPFMASIALNNVLPFRAGDVTRALVFPARLGIGRGFAAATLVVERLLDLLCVLLLMSAGLFAVRGRLGGGNFVEDMVEVGAGFALLGGLGVLGGILLAPRLASLLAKLAQARRGGTARAFAAAANLMASVGQLRSGRLWAALVPVSVLIWLLEAGVFWAVLAGIGRGTAGEAALLGSVGTLATLVPSTPGYVGTFHLAVQQTAGLLGLSDVTGSTVAIVSHAILWMSTTAVGLAALLGLSARARSLRSDQ